MALLQLKEKEKSDDWKWSFSDYPKEKNGLKVFSCFSCGGGSTMGYKLAGCDVIGNVEIDEKMNELYKLNHNPKYNYCMDIRDFNRIPNEELPEELFNLDILDGSPPCTTFSMGGDREKTWGKKKKFREGQKEQTLDDLLFVFIDTVEKLQPKTVIMENVEGRVKGNAVKYVHKVYDKFKSIGYQVRCYLLKAENMGVPQKRHRVFFIATSNKDFNFNKLNLNFNYNEVTYGMIRTGVGKRLSPTFREWADKIIYGDLDLSDVGARYYNRPNSFFNYNIVYDEKVCNTIAARDINISYITRHYISDWDIIYASTFPIDYNFENKNVSYVCVE